MGRFRQEYCGRLPFPPPGDLPHPETEPVSLVSSALTGGFFTTSPIWEALLATYLQRISWLLLEFLLLVKLQMLVLVMISLIVRVRNVYQVSST